MKTNLSKIMMIIGGLVIGIVVIIVAFSVAFDSAKSGLMREDSNYNYNYKYPSYDYDGISGGAGLNNESISRIITNNYVSIETKNITKTITSLEGLIEKYEGIVIGKNVNLGDSPSGYLNIKIPSQKGKDFVDELNKKYEVSALNTDVSDVTEQYVNTEKEIENLKRKIKLYETLAAETPIKDIETRIRITDHIFSLEMQIERLIAQNQDIDKKVEYRDVRISLLSPDKIQGERNYLRNTTQMVISTFQGSFKVIVAMISISVPFLIVLGIPSYIVMKKRNK